MERFLKQRAQPYQRCAMADQKSGIYGFQEASARYHGPLCQPLRLFAWAANARLYLLEMETKLLLCSFHQARFFTNLSCSFAVNVRDVNQHANLKALARRSLLLSKTRRYMVVSCDLWELGKFTWVLLVCHPCPVLACALCAGSNGLS